MEPKKYKLEIEREWKSPKLYINKTYCLGTLQSLGNICIMSSSTSS